MVFDVVVEVVVIVVVGDGRGGVRKLGRPKTRKIELAYLENLAEHRS